MRLTKKKAIEITIELWTFLAETGKRKEDWDGWGKIRLMDGYCVLCKYGYLKWKELPPVKQENTGSCDVCPYYKRFDYCNRPNKPYYKWRTAITTRTLKKYAKEIVEQLKQLEA